MLYGLLKKWAGSLPCQAPGGKPDGKRCPPSFSPITCVPGSGPWDTTGAAFWTLGRFSNAKACRGYACPGTGREVPRSGLAQSTTDRDSTVERLWTLSGKTAQVIDLKEYWLSCLKSVQQGCRAGHRAETTLGEVSGAFPIAAADVRAPKQRPSGSALRPCHALNRLGGLAERPARCGCRSRKRIAAARIRTIHNESGQRCGPVVDILRKNNLSG